MKYTGLIIAVVAALFLLSRSRGGYKSISQQEAKQMMDSGNVLVLDVREQDEYSTGHIGGAVLLPVGTINADTASKVIPSKDTTVLVYCRSGNRSKKASAALAKLGYTNIYEIGGITTWPYGVE
ncbi:MAG: rhodanese-like domain-containing protein [Oscillospiraceae bacterium]|nr:rhodanese-like domain-containing protein [Oscillospiraceae bacterium]MBQ5314329.1 rhodanese-like domain-containing protein [Oscillospiraceae bacterium]